MSTLRFPLLLVTLLLVGFVWSGCADDTVEPPAQESARLLVVHAAVNGGAVDIEVDGEKYDENRVFKDVIAYKDVNAGAVNVTIKTTGTETVLFDEKITVATDKIYTLFIAQDVGGDVRVVLYRDDLTAPDAGKAHLRAANLVNNSANGLRIGIPFTQQPLTLNLAYAQVAESFNAYDAQERTIKIVDAALSGGMNGGVPVVLTEVTETLADKGLYTVAVVGTIENTEVVLIKHN